MKISDIAEKNGFNYHEFETFCRTTAGIKVKGTFSSNIDDNDVNRVVSMFQDMRNAKMEEAQRQQEYEKRQQEYEKRKQSALKTMLVTTGYNFEGYSIDNYCGYISGSDVQKSDQHGVIAKEGMINALDTARAIALDNLKIAAFNLGCNAIIGLSFDYLSYEPTVPITYHTVVTANGTAVMISKK